jgi:hypothetical protein
MDRATLRAMAEQGGVEWMHAGGGVWHGKEMSAGALHLGMYSVHTTAEALDRGEGRINELHRQLRDAGNRRTASGTVPVFR